MVALVVMEIGLITPPVGMNVYVINGVARDIPMGTIFRGVAPFLVSDILRVLVLGFSPASLWSRFGWSAEHDLRQRMKGRAVKPLAPFSDRLAACCRRLPCGAVLGDQRDGIVVELLAVGAARGNLLDPLGGHRLGGLLRTRTYSSAGME